MSSPTLHATSPRRCLSTNASSFHVRNDPFRRPLQVRRGRGPPVPHRQVLSRLERTSDREPRAFWPRPASRDRARPALPSVFQPPVRSVRAFLRPPERHGRGPYLRPPNGCVRPWAPFSSQHPASLRPECCPTCRPWRVRGPSKNTYRLPPRR